MRQKINKKQYRVRNWAEYNAALVRRGSLTVWVEESSLKEWLCAVGTCKRGAPFLYSDVAITTVLLLKLVYRLPLRGAQGMAQSILALLGLNLPVPHYSTLSRRQAKLSLNVPRLARRENLHLVVDSTGCKVYGEGEWKVRIHGKGKRRTWRKLHLGVDESSGEIIAAVLSSNNMGDGEVLPQLLDQVEEPIVQLSGDGGYDQSSCYQALHERAQEQDHPLKVTIPPRHGARIWKHGNSHGEKLARDENLRRIRKAGRKRWKEESGYHRRSLAETAMSRYKRIIGEKLQARDFSRQAKEAFIGIMALNRMTILGMPQSYAC